MESPIEVDSDSSEVDDDTDLLVRDYLNDTRVESERAKRTTYDLVYTSEQLENISLYKNAIALNRETEATYKKLENSLVTMLAEVRKRLKDNEAALLKHPNSNDGFNYLRCGKPYFKDKNNFSAPENDDTKMMKQAEMYDFSQVCSVPGWTVKDKTELINALLEMSRDIKKKKLRSEISRLRKDDGNIMEITKLEKEIDQLNKKTLAEIALPLDQEYDWEYLVNLMNRRHTEQEYQALWKLFFHPSINKCSWTKTEHQELQKIASALNNQDWDNIAKQLDTGRTGYQCFVYYRTNLNNMSQNRKWTSEEIEYLLRVVDYFREGTYIPWGKVASAMDGRTKVQVYNKYNRLIERRKGRFLEEEDVVLLNCYEKFGNDFRKISEFLPGRSTVQIKTRFQILTKFRVSTTWSIQDDKKLIQIMANLHSSSSFSNATKYFPGKDRANIRSRYLTLMKWMKTHPSCDISMAPRRGARRLAHSQKAVSLNDAITNLNKRIESEVNTKKRRKITIESNEKEIEDGIMATLINEIIKDESTRKLNPFDLGERVYPSPQSTSAGNINNMRNLLIFLNAALDKDKFDNSEYVKKYPGLSEIYPNESIVKVKSYSKKKTIHTIQMNDFPDIWGTKRFKRTSYVLPPNYATITGCRVLMKHFGAKPVVKPEEEINLSLMQRRNIFLRQAMDTLKERFATLFMWPILLSNELPDNVSDKPYVPVPLVEKKYLPNPRGVTIPRPKKYHLKDAEKFIEIDEPQQSISELKKIQCSSGIPKTPGFSDPAYIFDENSL